MDVQDQLQTLYTSGTVFHTFLGERLPNWKSTALLVRKIAENYKLPYYTMSPTYSICKEHGYINGEEFTCPICGKNTEVYSRITGYYRPVRNWNTGKAEEFKERKEYDFNKTNVPSDSDNDSDSLPPWTVEDCKEQELNEAKNNNELMDGVYLFTSKTCPNCEVIKRLFNDNKIDYYPIDVSEQVEIARKLKIFQAPTLVIIKDGEITAFSGITAIQDFYNL